MRQQSSVHGLWHSRNSGLKNAEVKAKDHREALVNGSEQQIHGSLQEVAMQESSMSEYQDGIEILDRHECFRLLHEGSVGCLGLPSVEAPELRTVNYVVDGRSLIIRTGEGQILEAGRHGLHASFQIFGIDGLEHTGWSVLVTGKLSRLTSENHDLAFPLRSWAPGCKDRFVGLSMSHTSGRRIPPGRGNR